MHLHYNSDGTVQVTIKRKGKIIFSKLFNSSNHYKNDFNLSLVLN